MKYFQTESNSYSYIPTDSLFPNISTLGNLTTTTAINIKEDLYNYNPYSDYYYPNYSYQINPTLPIETVTTTTTTDTFSNFINYNPSFDYSNNLLYPDPYIMSHESDLHYPHGQSGKKARQNNKKVRQSRCISAEGLPQNDIPTSSSSSSPIIKNETLSSPSTPSSIPYFSFFPINENSSTSLTQHHQRLQQLQEQHQLLQQQQLSLRIASSSSIASTSSSSSSIASNPSSPIIYNQVIKEMESELDHLNDELHVLTVLMDGLKTTFLEEDDFYRTHPSGSLRSSPPQEHELAMEKEKKNAFDNLAQDITNVAKKFETLMIKLDRLRRMDHLYNHEPLQHP